MPPKPLLTLLPLLLTLFAGARADALQLVRNGSPRAEIVIPADPMPQVTLAATELRDHIQKMTGAELTIVTEPGGELTPIYVGQSDPTRALGLDLSGIDNEGYKIIATDDSLALFGHDEIFPLYPRGYTHASERERLLAEWQDYAGRKWDFPFLQFYDPRHFNSEFGFSIHDPSGTLFAVYDLLEQLGVRWYLPVHDFGTILPETADLSAPLQNVTRVPTFDRRWLRFGWGSNRETFLWSKRLRLGMSEINWHCHGTTRVTRFKLGTHPEYFSYRAGRPMLRGHDSGLPRLAPPLRDAMIDYARTFFNRYPEQRHVSVGPADGYTSIDDRDIEAGWLREERGRSGRLSDYVWTFINEVAEGLTESHSDKIAMGLAYSFYREPPTDLERLHPNVGITYCQARRNFFNPETRDHFRAERLAWREMMGNDEFYLWEYYLWHRRQGQLWGVPVIFWRMMQEDTQALQGVSKGEYVEAWTLQNGDIWGLNHMTIYLQSRLYWEPDLDMDTLLDEYYTLFFGPAAADMREFFEFAEAVWMRPESRTITLAGGFLRREDVDRFFEILERARAAAAGQGDYARRVELIIDECQPMRDIHDRLTRVGPDFHTPRVSERPVIDGNLDKPFWRDADGALREPHYPMRHLHTGEVMSPETTVLLRWAEDDSGLYIGIACSEPAMAQLKPSIRIMDSFSIYDEDFVEIFIERPGRAAFKIVANALGTTMTEATDGTIEPSGTAWNPGLEIGTRMRPDGWNVELFIPLAGLDNADPPDPEAPWGINVCRTRFITGRAENSAIAPTAGRFFTPPKFGNIIVD